MKVGREEVGREEDYDNVYEEERPTVGFFSA
jgi:hypothetical protein